MDDHEYDNELYSMHPVEYDPVQKISGDDDELQYNSMYGHGQAVENEYASVHKGQYHYVQH